ncbi:putative carboxylesterase 15 [Panicum miliaceum]|uniref:Carboxylesterase 15 n=1 Tax=Panicum miliaceum TaxID=4540 RepID=A0A3L6SA43_PANMI|nr:putative carboxylesterase 15 [Panicum miliaceum]
MRRNARGKLPVLVYFHGGGYVFGTFALPSFHACCLRLRRRAPGCRPASPPTTASRPSTASQRPSTTRRPRAMSWVRARAVAGGDPWLAESADFGRVFVAGDSAGGNIVHHVAVRLLSGDLAGARRRARHVLPAGRLARPPARWPASSSCSCTASRRRQCQLQVSMGAPK